MSVSAACGEGRLAVAGTAILLGDDVLVHLTGGTGPHIGAVALAVVRPSLAGEGRISSTPSLLTLPGHKEDALALEGATSLAAATGRNVVLVAGLHVDEATPGDIRTLVAGARQVLERLAVALTPKA